MKRSSWTTRNLPSRTRAFRRALLVAVGAIGLVVAPAQPATAHTELMATDPANGVVVGVAPSEIRLTFSQEVRLVTGGLTVTASSGEVEGIWELVGVDAVFTPGQVIPPGSVLVDWRVVSDDGYPMNGTLIFHVQKQTVTIPDEAPPPPRPLAPVVANAVMYLGLLIGGGVALFLVHVHDGGRDWLPLRRLATLLLLLGLAGVVVSLTVKTIEATGGFRFEDFPSGALPALVTATVGIGIVVSTIGRRGRVSVTVGVVVALASLVFVGHTRSFGPTWLVATADLLHVTAGAFFAGGLTALAFVCRQRRTSLSADSLAAPAIAMIRQFSAYAGWSLAAIIGTGSVLAWRILGSWESLIATAHGRFLIVKIAIVAIVATIGAFNRYRVVPHVVASAGVRSVSRLGTTTAAEAAALALLLMVAGALVEQDPRGSRRADAMALAGPVQTSLGDYHVTMSFDPGGLGVNHLQLAIRESGGQPVTLSAPPSVSIDGDYGRTTYETQEIGGLYEVTVKLPTTGVWEMEVRVDASNDAVTTLTFDPISGVLVPRTGIISIDPRMPLTPGLQVSVVHLALVSAEDDELIGVSSEACEQASFHETVIGSDGTATMQPRPALALPSGASMVFTSGRLHIMCGGLDPEVSMGDLLPFTLTTASGGSVQLLVRAVSFADLLD